jgi:CO/xanthine dehydrogenase FAD-binding subunit
MTLRDVTNLGYLHGKRTRFRAGTSALLGVTLEPRAGEGFIVDVTTVPEMTMVTKTRSGKSIGAFITLEELAERAPELAPPGATAHAVRLRCSLFGAFVTVAGAGQTRRVALDELVLQPHEVPIAIEVHAPKPGLGLGDRRLATTDGDASYALGVSAALRIHAHRFTDVRIMLDVDGALHRASAAEEKLSNQRADPGLFPEAARLSALTIAAVDARTSAAARAALPLVTAALREALDHARTSAPPERARARKP